MIGGLSMTEVIIILGLALLLLGPDQLPTLAKSLGKGLKELRKATDDIKSQFESEIARIDINEPAKPASPSIAPVPPPASNESDPAAARAAARRAASTAAQLTLVPEGAVPQGAVAPGAVPQGAVAPGAVPQGTVPREMPREVVPPASWVHRSRPVTPAQPAPAAQAPAPAPAAQEPAAQQPAPAAQEPAASPEAPSAAPQEQKA
ncbi:MAG TPA: twin-arginine translocase TatA/TatE family subunit [Myxococcales bacterium]|nr:twin-arginine translocase TatA/TatE family subunit [Myxococcales bacterium]